MIGILKPAYLRQNDEELLKDQHWLSYCGACKSIGNEYGQIYRIGLNYDLALLGQLSADLAGISFDKSNIKPRKCFSKTTFPEESEKLMRYIAALHLFWYQAKIKDNAEDEKTWYWRLLNSGTNASFQKARHDLKDLGVDINWVQLRLKKQRERELGFGLMKSDNTVGAYAQISGEVTGYFFKQAVMIAGAPSQAEVFEAFGKKIGRAIYITDAADDLEEDRLNDCFNPFERIYTMETAERKKALARERAIEAWNEVYELAGFLTLSSLNRQQLTTRVNRIIEQIRGVGCESDCKQSSARQNLRKVAAATTAILFPAAVTAQSQSNPDDCGDTCCGCCFLSCFCGCCLAACASPSSSANCACDACCDIPDDPNCRWY
ncbi:MAG: DUF5685 family protein [Balneolales bacterium]|nr:DUF5685 family protein [Balneolales bacterium]